MRFPQRPDVETERFRADPLGIGLAVIAVAVLLLPLVLPACERRLEDDPFGSELATYLRVVVGFTGAQLLGTLAVARCAPKRYRRGLLVASFVGLTSLVLTIWLAVAMVDQVCRPQNRRSEAQVVW